jgi:predicted DNA binding CopG/RHH family protein
MKKNYDFSKGKRNPYVKRLKKQVTIRLEEPTLDYFKGLADDTGIPYQTLINLFLRDCAKAKKRPSMKWRTTGS